MRWLFHRLHTHAHERGLFNRYHRTHRTKPRLRLIERARCDPFAFTERFLTQTAVDLARQNIEPLLA